MRGAGCRYVGLTGEIANLKRKINIPPDRQFLLGEYLIFINCFRFRWLNLHTYTRQDGMAQNHHVRDGK